MPQMEKSKLLAFAKRQASPPPAASLLAQKRAAKAPPPAAAPPAKGAPKPPAAAEEGEETQMHLFELVEEAAEQAEAGQDIDLEDVIAGAKSEGPEDVPAWAEDKAKWAEAASAVGLGIPGTEDKYDEPVVVAAYLYKMIGGPVKGLEIPAPPAMPEEEGSGADMTKPGAAAKALHARAAAKAAPAEGAPKPPPAKPAPGAKPPVAAAKPAPGAKPAPEEGAAPPDELKALTDEAAKEAAESPDAALVEKLQAEPPQEGTPPSWAADAEKWAQAETAVMANRDAYPEPWIVVAHVYKKMGGVVA